MSFFLSFFLSFFNAFTFILHLFLIFFCSYFSSSFSPSHTFILFVCFFVCFFLKSLQFFLSNFVSRIFPSSLFFILTLYFSLFIPFSFILIIHLNLNTTLSFFLSFFLSFSSFFLSSFTSLHFLTVTLLTICRLPIRIAPFRQHKSTPLLHQMSKWTRGLLKCVVVTAMAHAWATTYDVICAYVMSRWRQEKRRSGSSLISHHLKQEMQEHTWHAVA